MISVQKFLFVCFMFSLSVMQAQNMRQNTMQNRLQHTKQQPTKLFQNPSQDSNDTINDADIDKVLHALIFGVDCSGGEIAEQRALPKGVINASNNATIDSTKYRF